MLLLESLAFESSVRIIFLISRRSTGECRVEVCSERKKCCTWPNTHWALNVRWANVLSMSLFAWHVSQLIFWLLIFCQTRFSNVSLYRLIESTKPNMLSDLVLAVDPFWSHYLSSSLIDHHVQKQRKAAKFPLQGERKRGQNDTCLAYTASPYSVSRFFPSLSPSALPFLIVCSCETLWSADTVW